ncbi:uncharacterized protein [Amphiura filiformis]|uniref:uncharacterized protein n=1 Tax=Amphiura filiformis TaxID=82378 RepID=UPI003B2232C6
MFFIILLFVLCSRALSAEVLCDADELGMQNGLIENSQITASSYRSRSRTFDPWRARLNNPTELRYWRPASDAISNSWIQVDFLDTVIVTGIETQGSGDENKAKRWVTTFQVQIGNETSKTYITDGSNPKVFSANTDINSIERITFPQRVRTRYLRILPIACHNKCGLRFEVLGCRLIDECMSRNHTDQCDTNAECHDQDDGFHCTCHPGYFGNGTHCEDINECSPNPCLNGGTCKDEVDSYNCSCVAGFTGVMCQTAINHLSTEKPTPSIFAPPSTQITGEYNPPQFTKRTVIIITGAVIGVISLVTLVAMVVWLVYRHKKRTAYSTNSGLELHGPYCINTQGFQGDVTTNPASHDHHQSDSLPISNEANDDIDMHVQERNKDYQYEQVDKNTTNDGKTPSAPHHRFIIAGDEGRINNPTYTSSDADGNHSKLKPPVYAIVMKSKKSGHNGGSDQQYGADERFDESKYMTMM